MVIELPDFCLVLLVGPSGCGKTTFAERHFAAGEIIGEPVNCVNLSQIRNSEVRDDKTIDFMMRGGKVYRNELPYQCSTLGFDRAFSYATSQAQLCNVDIITVVRNIGGRLDSGGSCGLGMFTPVELIKQPKAK